MIHFNKSWAFILGGSGGFGMATARLLAQKGLNIFIVHRDTRSHLPEFIANIENIRQMGVRVASINCNAVDYNNKDKILTAFKEAVEPDENIRLFLHAIADGNLNPIFHQTKTDENETLSMEDYQQTINAMGLSFIFWGRTLFEAGYLQSQSRIIGISSEGSHIVLPYYAAVSSAKAVLESACKYMAVELARQRITVNLINAGITDTAALSVFPNYTDLIEKTLLRNPSGRLTTTEDIAKVVFLLCQEESQWITGEVIRADGGEQLVNLL
jgi:enoyl-[acyl-carrier protein] reductase III